MQTSTSRQLARFHERASTGSDSNEINVQATTARQSVSLPVVGEVSFTQLLAGAGAIGLLLLLFGVIGSGGGDSSSGRSLPTFTLTPSGGS